MDDIVKKGVAKIVNKQNNKGYVISSCRRDIDNHIDGVISDLENGRYANKNKQLQEDYTNNPEAFKSEIIHIYYGKKDDEKPNSGLKGIEQFISNKYDKKTSLEVIRELNKCILPYDTNKIYKKKKKK